MEVDILSLLLVLDGQHLVEINNLLGMLAGVSALRSEVRTRGLALQTVPTVALPGARLEGLHFKFITHQLIL